MDNIVTKEKLEKYFKVTRSALVKARDSVFHGKEDYSEEIFDMVKNYLSDAEHFMKKGDYVNAFAALNYGHGWLDCGVRLDVFDVTDDKLFTVK